MIIRKEMLMLKLFKYLLFISFLLLFSPNCLGNDDVTDPLAGDFDQQETNDCYCNNGGGTALISTAMLEPSEQWIDSEISQMIVDAKNESYYIKEYWRRGLAAEYKEFGTDALFSKNFLLPQEKLSFELEKSTKLQCTDMDNQINNLNLLILQIEEKISLIKQ